MFELNSKLLNYADLIIKVGVNLQEGQSLHIRSSLEAKELTRHLVEKAYNNGAKVVHVDWSDEQTSKIHYENAPLESLQTFPSWKALERNTLAEEKAAFISIVSEDPDVFASISSERLSAAQRASGKALVPFRRLMQADQFSWTVVAAASPAWAAKVFPEVEEKEQVNHLWDAIFAATRITEEDPVTAWKKHDAILHEKADALNALNIDELIYTAPGTDLTIGLPEGHIWTGGSSVNADGHTFMANMPTEEVFTAPHKDRVNGFVSSTKPLSYSGNIIDDFTLTFKDGAVVDVKAAQGEDVLKQLIATDEGSKRLGEVALVPHDSPISNSNTLFYNTLFDENASNHLAVGSAYTFCLEGGKDMTPEETAARGLNDSLTHVDFMIGSAEMNIDAKTHAGEIVPIFRNGNWAL
ncbi:aminopeptidase [Savagea faecisuis]|uniref:Aminopeptidase n=1 Tax=Savagea faecisuis TaxID=1274803 RepID=A0ABW3H5F2_9BACL